MSDSCGHSHSFDGMNDEYKRRLMVVTALNIGMFLLEMTAGQISGSQALKADALDFFADGVTYALSFWAIGRPLQVRASAAFIKGLSLLAMGLWVAGSTLYQVLAFGVPQAEVMSIIGIAALAANLLSVWMLMAYKDGDSNVRSVWLCSRNDAIGNVAVVVAAGFVWWLNSGIPDLVVAGAMSLLFLNSSQQILRQSYGEWREARSGRAHAHNEDQCCDHEHEHHH